MIPDDEMQALTEAFLRVEQLLDKEKLSRFYEEIICLLKHIEKLKATKLGFHAAAQVEGILCIVQLVVAKIHAEPSLLDGSGSGRGGPGANGTHVPLSRNT